MEALSILSRAYTFDYWVLIKRYSISLMIMMVLFAGLLMVIFNHSGIIYTKDIDIIANILCIVLSGFLLSAIINVIRTNDTKILSYLIPLIISLPAIWQIVSSVLVQKLYVSLMFIPIVQSLKSLLFG